MPPERLSDSRRDIPSNITSFSVSAMILMKTQMTGYTHFCLELRTLRSRPLDAANTPQTHSSESVGKDRGTLWVSHSCHIESTSTWRRKISSHLHINFDALTRIIFSGNKSSHLDYGKPLRRQVHQYGFFFLARWCACIILMVSHERTVSGVTK
jgi:hypothetical protein